jgi:hypothetical protein
MNLFLTININLDEQELSLNNLEIINSLGLMIYMKSLVSDEVGSNEYLDIILEV